MILKRNTEPQNFSQNSPKIQKYLGIIYLLSITESYILKSGVVMSRFVYTTSF